MNPPGEVVHVLMDSIDEKNVARDENAGASKGTISDERGRFRTEFWFGARPPSEAVVEAVAVAADVDPFELPPLHGAVDLDAVDGVFAPRAGGERRAGVVTFDYEGFLVTVESHGTVTVEPADGVVRP